MPTVTGSGFVWIPPYNHPEWKIKITRKGGTIDDISEDVYDAKVTMGATETIGDFSVEIGNSDETYTDLYSGGETVEIFLDYNDGSTRIFKGLVDKVGYIKEPELKVSLKGRHIAEKLLAITVTKQYANIETSVILTELFDTYAPEFTYVNVNVSSTNVTVNWYQKPFWECVIDLCNSAGFDAYIDDDKDCHYFEEKTIQNDVEAIVHDDNMKSVSDFGSDTTDVKNRVIVYGQNIGDLPLIAMAEDATSQSDLFIKEEIITDTNINSMDGAQERANDELQRLKSSVDRGEVEAFPGLPTLNPGEMLFISDPTSKLTTYYKVIQLTHKFEETGVTTTVTIEKGLITVARILRERILSEQKLSDILNPFGMSFSYNFTFDDDSQVFTHDKTETNSGRLLLQTGQTTGTMESKSIVSANNITHVHLKVKGESLPGTNYWVSVDDGLSWEAIDPDVELAVGGIGTHLRVKVELNNTATQIDSLALLYRS